MLTTQPVSKAIPLPYNILISEIMPKLDVKSILTLRHIFKQYNDNDYLPIWKLFLSIYFPHLKLSQDNPKEQFKSQYKLFIKAAKHFPEGESSIPNILKLLDGNEIEVYLKKNRNVNEERFQNALLNIFYFEAVKRLSGPQQTIIINDVFKLAVFIEHIELLKDILKDFKMLINFETHKHCYYYVTRYCHSA